MRDRGLDFRWHDHPKNLLSIGFDAAPDEGSFELVTTFEVLEHLLDPIQEIEAISARGTGFAAVHNGAAASKQPAPRNWW